VYQLSIYDFLEEGVHDNILDRLSNIFNAEVLGYVKTWEWAKSDDYTLVIHKDGVYKIVSAELYHNGKWRIEYGEGTNFEPCWFEWIEKLGRNWVWRSMEDRERVFEVARQNAR
jgi:hypothetical protein